MEEGGCESIRAGGFSFLELMHCSVYFLLLNRAKKELVVIFDDDLWHVTSDFLNGRPSVFLGLLVNLPKMPYEFLLNRIMLLYSFPPASE